MHEVTFSNETPNKLRTEWLCKSVTRQRTQIDNVSYDVKNKALIIPLLWHYVGNVHAGGQRRRSYGVNDALSR